MITSLLLTKEARHQRRIEIPTNGDCEKVIASVKPKKFKHVRFEVKVTAEATLLEWCFGARTPF